jgi:hypothetical protein
MSRTICGLVLILAVASLLTGCGVTGRSTKSLVDREVVPPVSVPLTITLVDLGPHGGGEDNVFLVATGLWASANPSASAWDVEYRDGDVAAAQVQAARLILYWSELVNALRRQFPSATVLVQRGSFEQHLRSNRSLAKVYPLMATAGWCVSSKYPQGAIQAGLIPTDSRGADVVVFVWSPQAISAGKAYDWGTSHGGLAMILTGAHFADDLTCRFRSDRVHSRDYATVEASRVTRFNQQVDDAERASTRNELEAGTYKLVGRTDVTRQSVWSEYYLDWPELGLKDDDLIDRLAKAARQRPLGKSKVWDDASELVWQSTPSQLAAWTGDPSTSPFKPLWDLTAKSIAKKLATRDLNQIRASALREWSAVYETDESIRATITPAAVADLKAAPTLVRALAKIQTAEATLLSKITDETVVKPAAGPVGDAIRDFVRAQESGREQYYSQVNSAIFKGVAGSAAGLAAGAAGVSSGNTNLNIQGMNMQMSAMEVANTSLRLATEVDEAASRRLNEALADTIGPILLELEGESYSFRAGSLEDLRPQLKAKYDQLRQRVNAGR